MGYDEGELYRTFALGQRRNGQDVYRRLYRQRSDRTRRFGFDDELFKNLKFAIRHV